MASLLTSAKGCCWLKPAFAITTKLLTWCLLPLHGVVSLPQNLTKHVLAEVPECICNNNGSLRTCSSLHEELPLQWRPENQEIDHQCYDVWEAHGCDCSKCTKMAGCSHCSSNLLWPEWSISFNFNPNEPDEDADYRCELWLLNENNLGRDRVNFTECGFSLPGDITLVQLLPKYQTAGQAQETRSVDWRALCELDKIDLSIVDETLQKTITLLCLGVHRRKIFRSFRSGSTVWNFRFGSMAVMFGCSNPPVGDSCTPRCPKGFHPTVEQLQCKKGLWTPSVHTCYKSKPVLGPVNAMFVDMTPVRGYISGHLTVELGHPLPREFEGVTEVKVFFGSVDTQVNNVSNQRVHRQCGRAADVGDDRFEILGNMVLSTPTPDNQTALGCIFNHLNYPILKGNDFIEAGSWGFDIETTSTDCLLAKSLQDLWLPNTKIPAGATHLLLFNSNPQGMSCAFPLVLVDVGSNPLQPMANLPFNVGAHGLSETASQGGDVHLQEGNAYDACLTESADSISILGISILDLDECLARRCATRQESAGASYALEKGHYLASHAGLYTLCHCTTFCQVLGMVSVTSQVVKLTGESDALLSPLIGSTFLAKVTVDDIHASGHLCLQPGPQPCGQYCSNAADIVVANWDSGNASLQWWRGVAWKSGSFRACWHTANLYNNLWTQPIDLGTFTVRRCEPQCRTCSARPDWCTSCMNRTLSLVNGTCQDCSRSGCKQTLVESMLLGTQLVAYGPSALPDWLARPSVRSFRSITCGLDVPQVRTPRHFDAFNLATMLVADPAADAIFLFNLTAGSINFACPTCCGRSSLSALRAPESVRIAPSGTFFLIADTGNFLVRRIEMTSLSSQIVAGSLDADGKPFKYSDSSEDHDGQRAITARLCYPVDLAIPWSEQGFLIAERKCQSHADAPSGTLRLVDQQGFIRLVATLKCAPMTIDWMPIDWLLNSSESVHALIVDDCNGIYFLAERNAKWGMVDPPEHVGSIFPVKAARLMPGSTLLLVLTERNSEPSLETIYLDSPGDPHILAGGSNTDKRRRPWSNAAGLPQHATIFISRDNMVLISDLQAQKISWLLAACAEGSGFGSQEDSYYFGCNVCPKGFYNDGTAGSHSMCLECPLLQTTTREGASHCTCKAGYYNSINGSNNAGTCKRCESKNYCDGSGEKQECPYGETTFDKTNVGDTVAHIGAANASSLDQCSCCFGKQLDKRSNECSVCHDLDWWDERNAKHCSTCRHALWCASDTSSSGAPLRARSGFWVNRSGPEVYTCAHPSHCWWSSHPHHWWAMSRPQCQPSRHLTQGCTGQTGGDSIPYADLHRLHCTGVQVGGAPGSCTHGRTGLACGRCQSGTYASFAGRHCKPCEDLRMQLAVSLSVFLVASAVLYAGVASFRKARIHALYTLVSSFGLFLAFAEQIRALHELSLVRWPRFHRRMFEAVALGLRIVFPIASECIGDATLLIRQGMLLVAPVLVLIAFLVLSGLLWATKGLRHSIPRWDCLLVIREAEIDWYLMINVIGVIASVLVVPYASAAFGFFQCFPHEWSGPDKIRVSSLWHMPDILCSSDAWYSALPLAILSLGYPIGWLALQIYIIRRLPMIEVAAPACGTPDQRLTKSFQHILARFRVNMSWWEISSCLRCFVVHVSLALPLEGTTIRYKFYVIFAVNALIGILLTVYVPHRESSVNLLEGALTCAMALLVMTGLSITPDIEEVMLWTRKSSSQNAISAAVLIVLLFTGHVFSTATKDLFVPAAAAKRKLTEAAKFVLVLQQISSAASDVAAHVLVEMFSALDDSTSGRVMRNLHLLEQLLSPSSIRMSTRLQWTRLTAFEFQSESIDKELHDVNHRHGSVQSISEATARGSSTGIASVVANNPMMAERMSIRTSKRTRTSMLNESRRSENVLGHGRDSQAMPTLLLHSVCITSPPKSPELQSPRPEATAEALENEASELTEVVAI